MPGDYAIGIEEQVFASEQSAFGTIAQPVAADAVRYSKCSITAKQERKTRTDKRGTRSRGETINLRKSADWSISGLIIPSGSLGVAPDIGLLLKHAFGKETVDPGVSVIYALEKHPESVLNGLSIHRFGGHYHQAVRGAIVTSLSLKASGENEAEFEVSGEGALAIHTGSSTVGATAASNSPTVQVATGDGVKYSVDSPIKVNGVGAHIVIGITGDILTVAPNIAAAQTVGMLVIPDEPVGTTAGEPLSGIVGAFSIDAVAARILSASFSLETKHSIRNNEYGTAVASGFRSAEARGVNFETNAYLTKAAMQRYGRATGLIQSDLSLTFGGTAGKRMVIDMNKTEAEIPGIDTPDADEATIDINGYALPTVGEDEATATFN